MKHPKLAAILLSWVECLFKVTLNDILVKYVTSHRCTVGLKKKLNQQLGPNAIAISYGALKCPSSHGHCADLFTPLIPETIPFLSPLMMGMGIRTAILLSCVEKKYLRRSKKVTYLKVFSDRGIFTQYTKGKVSGGVSYSYFYVISVITVLLRHISCCSYCIEDINSSCSQPHSRCWL